MDMKGTAYRQKVEIGLESWDKMAERGYKIWMCFQDTKGRQNGCQMLWKLPGDIITPPMMTLFMPCVAHSWWSTLKIKHTQLCSAFAANYIQR